MQFPKILDIGSIWMGEIDILTINGDGEIPPVSVAIYRCSDIGNVGNIERIDSSILDDKFCYVDVAIYRHTTSDIHIRGYCNMVCSVVWKQKN